MKPQSATYFNYPESDRLSSSADSNLRPVLLAWRSRFWFNFYDFMIRVVMMAPYLVRQPVQFWLPEPRMSFYEPVLSAFGTVHQAMNATDGREYDAIWLCCIQDRTISRDGRNDFRRRTLEHLGLAYRESVLLEGTHNPLRRHVVFANRTDGRKLSTLDQLLAGCSKDAALVCSVANFATVSYAQSTAMLQGADALVGIHGADLANSYLMADGALLVEVLGNSFGGHPRSYGLAAYKETNQTGLVHRRLYASETDPACAETAMARCANASASVLTASVACLSSKVWGLTINCAVDVLWHDLRELLVWPPRSNSSQRW